MRTVNSLIGSPIERLEDLRFLRGRGQYVDDVACPAALHAAILRSPGPLEDRIRRLDSHSALRHNAPRAGSAQSRSCPQFVTYGEARGKRKTTHRQVYIGAWGTADALRHILASRDHGQLEQATRRRVAGSADQRRKS